MRSLEYLRYRCRRTIRRHLDRDLCSSWCMGGLGRSSTLADNLVGSLVVDHKLVLVDPLAAVHMLVASHTEEVAAVVSKVTATLEVVASKVAALELVVGNLQVACPCLGFDTWVAAVCCSHRGSCVRSHSSAPSITSLSCALGFYRSRCCLCYVYIHLSLSC